jgi:hypothetical protein
MALPQFEALNSADGEGVIEADCIGNEYDHTPCGGTETEMEERRRP